MTALFLTDMIMDCSSCFVAFLSFIAFKMNYSFATSDGRPKRSSSSACDASWVIRQEMGSVGGRVDTTIVDQTECLSSCLRDSACVAVDIRRMATAESPASRQSASSATIECRVHQRQGHPLHRSTIPGSVQYEVLKRCGSHPDCEPLWVERYNMKGANGIIRSDLHGIDSCKSACVKNRACTSLHVYLHPRRGPTECWLNYEPRGSPDPPSSLLQSTRFLHLGLVDRCGASSQNVSQSQEKLEIPTTTVLVKLKPTLTITFLDINIILVSWFCITAVAVLSVVLLYRFKIRSMLESSSTQQSYPEDDEPQTMEDIYMKP